MASTAFEYTVSCRQQPTSPLTAELTCTEVRRRKITLSNDEINPLSFPDQTIIHYSGFISLNEPNDLVNIARSPNGTFVISRSRKTTNSYTLNCARISEIMRHFGITKKGCSTILRKIDTAIITSLSRGKGVIEVKIWKFATKVYKVNRSAAERLLIERSCSGLPAIISLRIFGYNSNGAKAEKEETNRCVICMEDYKQGSLVAKLPCDHEFHGVCFEKWLLINQQCPLCRFPISH